jgi:hypothetical protein
MTDYSAQSAAVRAARKALGNPAARPGVDFTTHPTPQGRWTWEKKPTETDPGAPPKEKATQSPGNAAEPQPPAPPPVAKKKASEKAREGTPPPAFPRANKKTREAQEAAARGILPSAPDFSAETHKRFRPKLAELEALVAAGDIAGLRAYPINPISTSPKALDRYRNLAVTALEAKAGEPAL